MHFDHSKIFVTKFALKFTEFQMFQPLARPSAFGCIDLWQPKTKRKVRNLRPSVDHTFCGCFPYHPSTPFCQCSLECNPDPKVVIPICISVKFFTPKKAEIVEFCPFPLISLCMVNPKEWPPFSIRIRVLF